MIKKALFFAVLILTTVYSQDTTAVVDSLAAPAVVSEDTTSSLSMDLSYGYKGFAWGSPKGSVPKTTDLQPLEVPSDSVNLYFIGRLGIDSVQVVYFFSDSGFWKVEIDFVPPENDIDGQIQMFKRLEKNISEVYGPTKSLTQVQSGPGPAYSDYLNPKFSRAFYRSTWKSTPVQIELLLSGLVLLPVTDLPIYNGNLSILKLVYYNPDFMYTATSMPEPEPLPSIFDIY